MYSENVKETIKKLTKEYKCKEKDIKFVDAEFLYIYYLNGKQIYAD